jgi:hypothetical protein
MSWGNTRALLDQVGIKLDHAPQDRQTREARLDVMNRRLYDVIDDADWNFMQVERDFLVWQERDYELTSATATFTNGAYLVTFSSTLGTFLSGGYANGLTISDGTDEYTIGQCVSGTQVYLTTVYTGTTGAVTTWSIKTDRVQLPQDCLRPLGYIDRENGRGRLVAWDRRREELYMSPLQNSAGDVWWLVEGDYEVDRPPDSTLTSTLSTVGGTLPASSIFQYCYCFYYQGRFSPPSIIVEATTGAGAVNQIVLAGLENTQDGGVNTGKKKYLFRRQVSQGSTTTANRNGRWLYLAEIAEGTTTYTDNGGTTPATADDQALHYEGMYHWIRPKLTPGSDATLRVRYMLKPKRLVSDADVPLGPATLGQYLVVSTAMEIAGTNSERAKTQDWGGEAQRLLQRLRQNNLQVPDLPTQKGLWQVRPMGLPPLRAGLVRSDFGT